MKRLLKKLATVRGKRLYAVACDKCGWKGNVAGSRKCPRCSLPQPMKGEG